MGVAAQLFEVRELQERMIGKAIRYFGSPITCYLCGTPVVACEVVMKNSISNPTTFRAVVEARCPNHPSTPVIIDQPQKCQPIEADPEAVKTLSAQGRINHKVITDMQIREAHTEEWQKWLKMPLSERIKRKMPILQIRAVRDESLLK